MKIFLALTASLIGTSCAAWRPEPPPHAILNATTEARSRMIEATRNALMHAGIRNDDRLRPILAVMARLPRELYVPPEQRASAYQAIPLPIGYGQTISDPFIVAYMTRRLDLRPTDRVLEVGTGSGYQAALLGSLVARVYTIEIVPELAARAAATLRDQGFHNIEVRQGDGYAGWPEAAPFDAIIVTAGASRIPPALFAQLKPGGTMIIPLGPHFADLRMTLVRKTQDGRARISACGWVMFVPFVGEAQRLEPGAPPVRGGHSGGRCSDPLGRTSTRARVAPSSVR